MPYLLIICDCRTLFPRGTQITDFQLTKGGFTGEQVDFSSPKPGSHASESLSCECKAPGQKPQGRNGPVPSTCSEGDDASGIESLFWCCGFPQEISPSPGEAALGFPVGCSTRFVSTAAIRSRNNLPRQTLALSVPFTLRADPEQAERRLLQSTELIYPSQHPG